VGIRFAAQLIDYDSQEKSLFTIFYGNSLALTMAWFNVAEKTNCMFDIIPPKQEKKGE